MIPKRNYFKFQERVMINRVSSRVGLTRLTFSPYNHQQLQEIVAARSENIKLVGLLLLEINGAIWVKNLKFL
jgi:Cdc6-like AAA superfamily ATPase